jgi:NAD(P)-dependent dehydrogenase (short-subunit alcohol dehydrogenase family)
VTTSTHDKRDKAGKVGLVTGAGAGLGEAAARRLAADGARIVVADRDAGAAERVAAELQLLCFVARFYSVSRIWRAYVGVLDVRALRVLQCLYEAAQRFGTEVRVQAIAAPDTWKGPCFSDSEELADLVTARADHGRLLGQPPLLT